MYSRHQARRCLLHFRVPQYKRKHRRRAIPCVLYMCPSPHGPRAASLRPVFPWFASTAAWGRSQIRRAGDVMLRSWAAITCLMRAETSSHGEAAEGVVAPGKRCGPQSGSKLIMSATSPRQVIWRLLHTCRTTLLVGVCLPRQQPLPASIWP